MGRVLERIAWWLLWFGLTLAIVAVGAGLYLMAVADGR